MLHLLIILLGYIQLLHIPDYFLYFINFYFRKIFIINNIFFLIILTIYIFS